MQTEREMEEYHASMPDSGQFQLVGQNIFLCLYGSIHLISLCSGKNVVIRDTSEHVRCLKVGMDNIVMHRVRVMNS
jgi:hypothetical protein